MPKCTQLGPLDSKIMLFPGTQGRVELSSKSFLDEASRGEPGLEWRQAHPSHQSRPLRRAQPSMRPSGWQGWPLHPSFQPCRLRLSGDRLPGVPL